MPIPLLIPAIIGISTIAGLATPFFFPTEQDKATIELNKTLSEGNFTITKTQPEIKVPSFGSKIQIKVDEFKQTLSARPELGYGIIAVLLVILLVLLK